MKSLFPILALGLFLAAAPLRAEAAAEAKVGGAGSALLEERFHAAFNEVVQNVRDAKTPAQKREILQRFATRMETGLEKAKSLESLTDGDRRTLNALQKKFYAYDAELNGQNGYVKVADADLNAYAGYMQQGMEQAAWSGGVYISGGALIVILILIILLIR